MNRQTALKAVLVLVCAAHLILGIIGYFAPPEPVANVIASLYGATLTITPQLQHMIRILGAFMVAIGILAAFALQDPQKNRSIIYGIAVLLILRVSQRLVFAQEIHEHFQVSYGKLWIQSIFFLALAIALLWLRPRQANR
jgi:hypothetical protein